MTVTLNLNGSVRICAQELCVEGLAVHRGLMPAISRVMCRGLENASYRFTCAFCAGEYSYCKSKIATVVVISMVKRTGVNIVVICGLNAATCFKQEMLNFGGQDSKKLLTRTLNEWWKLCRGMM